MMSPRRRISPLLAAVVLACCAMCVAGCDGFIRLVMIHAPNRGRTIDAEPGVLREGPGFWGIDRQLYVEVGPPRVLLRLWVIDPPAPALGADGRPRGTILVLHGYRNEAFWMRGTARRFAEAGYRAVLVDLRGHGGSSGDFVTFGAREANDLVQVIDALESYDLLAAPLGVWGISMGGSTAIRHAAQDGRPEAVVAIAPYTSMREVVPRIVRSGLPVVGWLMSEAQIQAVVDQAGQEAGFDPDDADALAAIRRTDTSILIIHGAWDLIVPPEHGRRLHAAAADHTELVELGLTGHLGAHFSGEVARRSIDFFDRRLAPAGGAAADAADAGNR